MLLFRFIYHTFALAFYLKAGTLINKISVFIEKMINKQLTRLFLFCILLPFSASAQVTIGSDNKPNIGAILDLKQTDSISVNSYKGLLLPRVALKNENKLYPMLKEGYDTNEEDNIHVGLIVYNTTNCFVGGAGPYVWDGEKWSYLVQNQNPDLYTFQDQDGNSFFARKFGEAGIWMVQNLAAKKYDPVRDKPEETIYTDLKIRYPNNDSLLTKDYPWMGVFYDFKTATNNASKADMDNQNIDIQGICPHGWHVPSTQEWYNLETEIIKKTYKYTSLSYKYIDRGIIQPELEIRADYNQTYGDLFRPALIDPCPMPGRSDKINGVSLKAIHGGFAVRMVGVMKLGTNNEYNAVDEYGTKAGFWVAYAPAEGSGRNRVFLGNSIYNNTGTGSRFYSIRCKKN